MARRNIYKCECVWHRCTVRSDIGEPPRKCLYGLEFGDDVHWVIKTLQDLRGPF